MRCDKGMKIIKFLKKCYGDSEIAATLSGVIGVCLIFSVLSSGNFLRLFNILNILKNGSVLAVASVGITIVIIMGQNDISVGSVMSLAGVICALVMDGGHGVWPAVLCALFCGLLCGLVNGIVIVRAGANFWVVTFAMMGMAKGLALVLSDGNSISGFPDSFRFIGTGKIGGIYTIIYLTAVIYGGMSLLLRYTVFGYHVYAVGNSEETACLAGIRVDRLRVSVYAVSGFSAGLAGILLAAKSNAAMPAGGSGYEFDAIAAAIIGGARFDGGKGTLSGTLTGVLLITVLRNGLSVLGVSSVWQYMIIGMIIMAIFIADTIVKNRKAERQGRRRPEVPE